MEILCLIVIGLIVDVCGVKAKVSQMVVREHLYDHFVLILFQEVEVLCVSLSLEVLFTLPSAARIDVTG